MTPTATPTAVLLAAASSASPSELTLLLLRLAFLLLIWVFVFVIVWTLRSDLFGDRLRRAPKQRSAFPESPAAPADGAVRDAAPRTAPSPAALPGSAPPASALNAHAATAAAAGSAAAPANPRSTSRGADTAGRLVVTAGAKAGLEIELSGEQLSIGRSSESALVIRDDYASTHHARLMLWNDQWVIQDLDSTNGTFIDGQRVTLPTPVPLGTPVTIGLTTFELRR